MSSTFSITECLRILLMFIIRPPCDGTFAARAAVIAKQQKPLTKRGPMSHLNDSIVAVKFE